MDKDTVVLDGIRQLLQRDEKIMVLMRGLPGSGKSSLARKILDVSGGRGIIRSADDFFMQNGVYRYDLSRLAEVHDSNQRIVNEDMANGRTPVIVDNTNLQRQELLPYAQMASIAGYKLLLLEPNTNWRYNVNGCAQYNSHSVPAAKIARMLERFDKEVTADSLVAECGGQTAVLPRPPAAQPRPVAASTSPSTAWVTPGRSWSSVCAAPTPTNPVANASAALQRRPISGKWQQKTQQDAGEVDILKAYMVELGTEVDEPTIADVLAQVNGDLDQAQMQLLQLFVLPDSDNRPQSSVAPPPGLAPIAAFRHSPIANSALTRGDQPSPPYLDVASGSGDHRNTLTATNAESATGRLLQLSPELVADLFRAVDIDVFADLDLFDSDLRVPLVGPLDCLLRDLVMQNILTRMQNTCGSFNDADAESDDASSELDSACELDTAYPSVSSTTCTWQVVATTGNLQPPTQSAEVAGKHGGLLRVKSESDALFGRTEAEDKNVPFEEVLEADISHALIDQFEAVTNYCDAVLRTTNKQHQSEMFDKLLSSFPPDARAHVAELVEHNLHFASAIGSVERKRTQRVTCLRSHDAHAQVSSQRVASNVLKATRGRPVGVDGPVELRGPEAELDDEELLAYDDELDSDDETRTDATADGVAALRRRVTQLWSVRTELFDKLKQVASGAHVQKLAVQYYATELRDKRVQLEQLERRLGRAFAAWQQRSICDKGQLDLHGLTYRQAACALAYTRRKLASGQWKSNREKLTIITGVGRHSKSNKPVLRPRIAALLRRMQLRVDDDSEGKLEINMRQLAASKCRM